MTGELGVFPLGTPLVPGQPLPLHVFEPRYRALVRHCLDGDRRFGVVLIERGHEVADEEGRRSDVPFETGTVAEILRVAELPDGRFVLETVGRERFRVVRWLPDDPYPRAEVEAGRDVGTADPGAGETLQRALRRVLALQAELGDPAPPATVTLAEDPAVALWQAAALAGLAALDVQALLEIDDVPRRVERLQLMLSDLEVLLRARAG